ncbi:uncharacterized protein LOC112568158 isoform X2 [Pomacea canaliculata]|uniref:uncharacterized protein LOC112568158 isoform X2 n=1 Tax=Pomacea canaliculata TaxID=400727 RepID=UPI000D73C390|nr:uncharacterized protein LOC112568158 isoform X2 [Pomacea canaliculata]
MNKFVACIFTILLVIISGECVTGTNNAWEYTCNIPNGITGVSWTILQPSYTLEVLSTCNISSRWCSRIEGCNAVATIRGLTSLLNISSSFLNTGQVACTEIKDNAEIQTHSNLTRHPINWTCNPHPVPEYTRGLSSTLQSTTTTVSDTSTTTSKVYPATSEATTTTSKKYPDTSKASTTISEATTTTKRKSSSPSDQTFTAQTAPVTHSPDTWKYQCEINENVTDILWILQSTNETETLSRCSVESESCDHRLEDLARATINSTSSFLYISDSFVGQKDGRVGYAEIINGLRGEIRFDARTNPMNRANDPSTETTEQTDASTDSPAATDSLAAWQYQCQIRENVTDVLWILQVGNETETLSRCYIGSESCDQRLDDCAIATINITSSLFNISANLEKVKAGRVGYAEMINGLNGEIRFDAKRNPIKWPCGPLTVTTGIFPSTKQTSESTDYSTGRTSP